MILDDGDNIMSDHFAIVCEFGIAKATKHGHSVTTNKADCDYRLQRDKADITSYQIHLNNLLSTVMIPVDALLRGNVYCHNSIISCLKSAANNCIPAVKVGFQKTEDLVDT